jgi:superfamily II DNA or RNA helicase
MPQMQGFIDFMEGEARRSHKAFVPRQYQSEAKERAVDHLQGTDKCSLYLATGTGKTEIAALLLKHDWGFPRSLFITPRRELVSQTAERLTLRGVKCGIEMAEQRSEEAITVACYASLQSRRRFQRYLQTVGLIIVDESHLNYSRANLEMLAQFREWGAKIIGMTASPPKKKEFVLRRSRLCL